MSGWGIALAGALGAAGGFAGSSAAADASEDAARMNMRMFEQTRRDLAPYREVGTQALNAYAAAMGLPGYSSQDGSVPGAGGLAAIPGATWRGRPVFVGQDENGYAIYSGRGRDWTADQGVSLLGYASEGPRGLRFDGTRIKSDRGILDFRGGNFYPGRGGRQNAIQLNFPEATGAEGGSPVNRYGGFETSPGYQFRMGEGQKGIDRGLAARGLLNSGRRGKALTRFNQDYASNEFSNYMNRLAGAAGIGQTAATNTGNFGAQAAARAGASEMDAGRARASGYIGAANTANNALNNYFLWKSRQGG